MAKAKVFEGRVRIESEVLDNETIRKALAIKPEALSLFNEKSEEEMFRVGCTDDYNNTSASKNGIVFNDGKAVTNIPLDEEGKVSNDSKYILDVIVARVNAIEDQIEEADLNLDVEVEIVE